MHTRQYWQRATVALAGVALAATLFAQPAVAQADPRSPRNVVPAVSGASAASLQSRRDALFARMLADPSNLDIAFEYAVLSEQAGDLEAAISTLERMLIFAPGLPRLQFELGVLYFRLGSWETASTYFRAVDAAPDVPADIRARVAAYLSAGATRAAGAFVTGRVTTGLRYQSNANAGPGDPTINLNGLDFTLDPAAMGRPDVNGFFAASLDGAVDLESQGDRLEYSLDAYGSLYGTQQALNTGIVELEVGPTFNLQRFRIDNASLGLYAKAGGAMMGGALYLATIGAGTELTFALDAQSRVVLVGEAQYLRYFDSALRPTASLRTGMHFSGEARFEHRVNPAVMLFAKAVADRRFATTGYHTNWQVGAEAGAVFFFASPIAALDAPWSIGLSGGVKHLVADAPDPVFSATDPERTNLVFVQASLKVPLPQAVTFEASASWTQSMSNYGFGNYTNAAALVALSKGF